jgi:hypothetical protein
MLGIVSLFDDMAETLHYGQEYTISIVIELPESDMNFNAGARFCCFSSLLYLFFFSSLL